MPEVVLSDLYKKFGKIVAVDHINLTVKEGQFLTLLGPSGCGKTTTLRLIAGFIKPDGGEVRVGDRRVSSTQANINVPPEKRKMAMVFQSYALWPHMTVLNNVMFGLRTRKIPVNKAKQKAMESLDLVQLADLADRFPHQLSGGQQQRVSLARAVVTEPEVLLLDEPLSNLDAKLREAMRFELRELHNKLSITTIYVTHDQTEAIMLSDEICLIDKGKIIQSCSPKEIYDNPNCCTVADFIGITNLMPAVIEYDAEGVQVAVIQSGDMIYSHIPNHPPDRTEVTLSVRPENIAIYKDLPSEKKNVLKGKIKEKTFTGNNIDYRVAVKENIIRVQGFDTDVLHQKDEQVYLWINPDKVAVLFE